jgi:hypothetical protein
MLGRKRKMDEDIFWGERNPQETEALKSLVDAEACLGEAIVSGSIELYSDALEFSEKVIECFPQCALAHYFAGFAFLRAKGDENFARQKYELLQSFNSEEANTLAQRLKTEIDKIKARS